MIEIAELLSKEVDFVRVDLYDLGSRIVFGELTNYPDGGMAKFKPKGVGIHLGSLLELDNSIPIRSKKYRLITFLLNRQNRHFWANG